MIRAERDYGRCTAPSRNLDGDATRRCQAHTELLVQEFELGTLWDEYGLVGDIVVGFISSLSLIVTRLLTLLSPYSHSPMTSPAQIFMNLSRPIFYIR
jgi:hypothetical protein